MVSGTAISNVKVTKYSPEPKINYDIGRHIDLNAAYEMINTNTDLDFTILQKVIESNEIAVYDFDGGSYLDRIDIGSLCSL